MILNLQPGARANSDFHCVTRIFFQICLLFTGKWIGGITTFLDLGCLTLERNNPNLNHVSFITARCCPSLWRYSMVQSHCSKFRIITAIFSGVQIFHLFKVIVPTFCHQWQLLVLYSVPSLCSPCPVTCWDKLQHPSECHREPLQTNPTLLLKCQFPSLTICLKISTIMLLMFLLSMKAWPGLFS